MAIIQKYISVVQRRLLAVDSNQALLFPLLEPLFAIETHMAFDERCRLFGLACSLRAGFVACEIGSYFGASTCFLAAAAHLKQGHVHAVDTWNNDAMPDEPVEDTWQRFLHNTAPFRPLITAHRGEAARLKDAVPAVDLLFVDGDHSYDGTLSHLADYVPKIVSGGILAMHDYQLDPVRNACRDYLQNRQIEDRGLTNTLQVFALG